MIDLYVPKPIFIGMILNEFDIVVTNESPKYTVTSILILTESNMGEVIDYWNLKSPLNEESYNEVSQTIRTHSRQMVEEFLQGQHL